MICNLSYIIIYQCYHIIIFIYKCRRIIYMDRTNDFNYLMQWLGQILRIMGRQRWAPSVYRNYIHSLFGILFTYQLVSTINCLIFFCKDFWEFVVILRHNVINQYILFYTTSWWLFFPVIGGDVRKMIRLLPTAIVCNLLYLRQLIV